MNQKVKLWVRELEQLSIIACSQPHAAHAAFTHGLMSKWTYISRTMLGWFKLSAPRNYHQLQDKAYIPALTGRAPPNDVKRDLLALPA